MYEVKVIARCEECREPIYEDNDSIYVDSEGDYFCSLECALNHHNIERSEST